MTIYSTSGFWGILFLKRQGSVTSARVSSAFPLWNIQIPRRLKWKSALSALEPLSSWTTRDVTSLPSIFSSTLCKCESMFCWRYPKVTKQININKVQNYLHQRCAQCQERSCVVWRPLSSCYPPGTLAGLCFFDLATTWQPLGNHLATTWQPLGNHLATFLFRHFI